MQSGAEEDAALLMDEAIDRETLSKRAYEDSKENSFVIEKT